MTAGLYAVTLYIEVHDLAALQEAARQNFVEANGSMPDAEALYATMRDEDPRGGVAVDLIQLLDPGMSPPGTSIQDSAVELLAAVLDVAEPAYQRVTEARS